MSLLLRQINTFVNIQIIKQLKVWSNRYLFLLGHENNNYPFVALDSLSRKREAIFFEVRDSFCITLNGK